MVFPQLYYYRVIHQFLQLRHINRLLCLSLLEHSGEIGPYPSVLVSVGCYLGKVRYRQIWDLTNWVIWQKGGIKQVGIVPSRKVTKTLDPCHIWHIVFNNTRC